MTPNPQQPYLFPNSHWDAKWIWAQDASAQGDNRVVLFRHVVKLPHETEALNLRLTACSNYRLWVNGELLGDGPCPSASHHSYFDGYELGSFPSGSEVTVAVLVRTSKLEQGLKGGLLAELSNGNGEVLAKSDDSWGAWFGDAWRPNSHFMRMNKLSPYQEHLDGRKLPVNWMMPEYEDQDWKPAKILSGQNVGAVMAPWTHLIPRPIDPLERKLHWPDRIVKRETCAFIQNRMESQDVSPEATQPGTVEGVEEQIIDAESLTKEAGSCRLSCSAEAPLDPSWDGVRDPAITLGFEEELTAFIEVELTASSGTVLMIASAERLIDGHLQTLLEGRFGERYVCREGRQVFRTLNWRAFRFLRLRLSQAQTPVIIHALRAIHVRTPFAKEALAELPKEMEEIDRLCRRTIRLCCVDGIFDTPWRESAQWLGDVALVTLPALHWLYGDTRLTGKFLVQAGLNALPNGLLSNLSNCQPQRGDNMIPDYSLWWIYALREQFQYSGEVGWYRMFYPEALRIMRWHMNYLDEEGFLTNVSQWVFIDWADVTKEGSLSTYNAIFTMACDVLAEMASFNGDERSRNEFEGFAKTIRAGFTARFWNVERELVVDGVVDGVQTSKVSEHGNAAALLFGCLPEALAVGLIEKAYVQGDREGWVECQPYFTRVLLEALYHHERRDLALNIIEERWGLRFRDRGWDTCLEEWTTNGSWRDGHWSAFQRTTSHAWSAGASEFFIRRMSGLEILEPGGNKISLNPYRGDFPYRLRIPLKEGEVVLEIVPGKEAKCEATEGIEII